MLIALGVFLLIFLLLAIFLISYYNKLVRGRNLAEEAWSGILVQLKRRHDLIPSLVNTVKAYAQHENDVLRQITEARSQAVSASSGNVKNVIQAERLMRSQAFSSSSGSVKNVMQAENNLTRAMRSLFAVAENYPQLKANENFLQLQDQLSQLEDEIQMSRRYYNGTARDQNNNVLQFPGNIIAGMFGFAKLDYFELSDESEAAVPEVKF
ncbi:MAG: LemA family protein [Mailhella sp.]